MLITVNPFPMYRQSSLAHPFLTWTLNLQNSPLEFSVLHPVYTCMRVQVICDTSSIVSAGDEAKIYVAIFKQYIV